jgi:hypothetical protein
MQALRRAAALGALGVLGCAAGGATRRATAMDDLKVTSAAVAGVEDPGGAADAVLKLQDGTSCTLGRQDPRFSIWLRLLKGAQTGGLPVYVECAPGGGAAKTLLPFAARRIDKVGEAAGDKAPVNIFMSPSIHHLNTARGDYAAKRAVLEEAAKTKAPVLLAVDPKTLEILAAVKPAEGAKVTPI